MFVPAANREISGELPIIDIMHHPEHLRGFDTRNRTGGSIKLMGWLNADISEPTVYPHDTS